MVEHATAPWASLGSIEEHRIPSDASHIISTFIRMPRCDCKDCRAARDEYMLMASHMFAFMLKDGTYGKLIQ